MVKIPARSVGRAALLTIPILLWALLMFSRSFQLPQTGARIAGLAGLVFMVGLFFQMMRTRQTYRWRRVFFVALGLLFPVGFIAALIEERGSMSISMEQMISGNTPFCFLAIPMVIIPAALTRTLIFPGSILPTASNPHSIAVMIALWFGATLALGKGWCAYGCFFGGIEEGFASLTRKARIQIPARYRLAPWAVLAAVVLLSAAMFEPVYCGWLCPFKAVTEYPEVRSVETAVQAGIFVTLFAGLVVVLPALSKKRTQCAYFCPFGAFQSLFNKMAPVEIRIRREECSDCVACRRSCPTAAIDADSVKQGGTLITCMKCGACVDACPKQAAVWHVKGTAVGAAPERARLLYLYGAWAFAIMFGGSILANSLARVLQMAGVR